MFVQGREQWGEAVVNLLEEVFIPCLEAGLELAELLVHRRLYPGKFLWGQNQVGRREDFYLLDVANTLLGAGVEVAEGVHLSIKQVNPDRIISVQGVNIDNRAPDGKVAGTQNHFLQLVAHCAQLLTGPFRI